MKKILLLLICFSGFSLATTGRANFSFTGNPSSDFASDENMGSRNGVTMYFTWNDTYIYICWSGGNTSNDPSDKYYFAIDINPGVNSGTTSTFGGLQWTGSSQDNLNKPDYAFLWRNSGGGGQYLGVGTTGSWTTSGKSYTEYVVWSTSGKYEVRIPWSDLGGSRPSSFSVWFWMNNSTESYVWSAFPTDIPNGSGTQTANSKWFFENTGTAQSPNSVSSSPIPVELASFTAKAAGKNIVLNWATATEVRNSGYDIERSTNKINWTKIGYIEGHGNSNTPNEYSFTDKNLKAGKYFYRLKQIDTDGSFEYYYTSEVDIKAIEKFELTQNFPNPFNPSTNIAYTITQAGNVKLTLYNALGQAVRTLVNEYKDAGSYSFTLVTDGLNSGVYFYKIESGNYSQVRKMMILR